MDFHLLFYLQLQPKLVYSIYMLHQKHQIKQVIYRDT
jgi:hypothetical protein